MFKKILIANRGEIVQRAIRTIKEMGKKAVAVYSAGDKEASYLKHADEAVCIGPAKSAESYLSIPAIIAAYRTPGFKERDTYVLNMVSTYLSDGKSSKLYKKIVDEQKQAMAVQAINIPQMDYSIYALFALPLGDVPLIDLLNEMDEEVLKLQQELISEKDYQKLQNKFENRFVNSNSGESCSLKFVKCTVPSISTQKSAVICNPSFSGVPSL